ncbi:hypothetical protein JQ557_11805 [Bradyrhizobium sp. U87765 SZCCT0131]|uniref:hypothetical protein n=2 Tax=Bradyrhizobium TaxID=374 RepID=UPI001BA5584D|nr:hypothetical protein [Bradyrhizobium sp. U87765 SZCCT0131]MBR1265564.1 hypothetical protein [Bradyrhizobium sp. U87765 SZCCT0134]MBR1304175.1 hypothetical protein [Bradyrhizobium sp. U87765 SZCCT0110]MBR1319781.1 hypothetical protein [Bradyrhizobium sp. U87765 SZCCT0109]MBR1348106.1 hypothetical protein [Bradyrhizobium sp. U87765 SZCCT0048]
MRRMMTSALAVAALLAGGVMADTAKADYVPPFRGNDTGGIISYALVGQSDVRALAVDHCAQYGKVVKLTGVQPTYGGYLSFACVWVPPGHAGRPLRVRY